MTALLALARPWLAPCVDSFPRKAGGLWNEKHPGTNVTRDRASPAGGGPLTFVTAWLSVFVSRCRTERSRGRGGHSQTQCSSWDLISPELTSPVIWKPSLVPAVYRALCSVWEEWGLEVSHWSRTVRCWQASLEDNV